MSVSVPEHAHVDLAVLDEVVVVLEGHHGLGLLPGQQEHRQVGGVGHDGEQSEHEPERGQNTPGQRARMFAVSCRVSNRK